MRRGGPARHPLQLGARKAGGPFTVTIASGVKGRARQGARSRRHGRIRRRPCAQQTITRSSTPFSASGSSSWTGRWARWCSGTASTEADFRGERFAAHPRDLKGDNDLLVLTRPDVISGIHHAYLEAGADIIETSTFNGTAIAQADYGLEDVVYELNVAAARLACEAARAWTARTPDRPRFVAGAIGPTNRTLSLSPDVEQPGVPRGHFAQVKEAYAEQARGLLDGGCDLLLVETIFDTLNAKAALVAIEEVVRGARRAGAGHDLGDDHRSQRPHALRPDGRGVLGVDRPRAAVLGRDQLRAGRARNAPVPGRPRARRRHARQLLSQRRPSERVRPVRRNPGRNRRAPAEFAEAGLVDIVGGCCGTTPDHIRAIAEAVAGIRPRTAGTPARPGERRGPRYSATPAWRCSRSGRTATSR